MVFQNSYHRYSTLFTNVLTYSFLKISNMKVYNSSIQPNQCEMHNCLRVFVRICRWLGFFPVEGLDSPFVDHLKFNLKSIYSIYLFSSLLGVLVTCAVSLHGFFMASFSMDFLQFFMLNFCALISGLLYLKLAQNWPSMLKKAAEIEQRVIGIRITRNTVRKINATICIFIFMALVDHILCYIYMFRVVLNCMGETYITPGVFKNFVILTMPNIFEYAPYNIWTAMFLRIENFQASFLWSATDMMVIGASMYLSSYFRDLNSIIYSQKPKTENDWARLRLYYSQLVELVNEIDARLNLFVLLSFSSNLFSLCLQLFNNLNPLQAEILGCDNEGLKRAYGGMEHFVYYSFSFLFLTARALSLSILAAQVEYEAKEPSVALAEASAVVYSIEIQRFYRQIHYTTTGLSGSFFYVTRNMMLQVIGNVITYELVLLQFKQAEKPLDLYASTKQFVNNLNITNHTSFK